jgi:hypothetical protein
MNGLRLLFVTDTARDLIILPERSAVSARRYSTLGGLLVPRCSDSFNNPKGTEHQPKDVRTSKPSSGKQGQDGCCST